MLTPLLMSITRGSRATSAVLLAWGASRTLPGGHAPEALAARRGDAALAQFLADSAGWDRLCFAHELAVAIGVTTAEEWAQRILRGPAVPVDNAAAVLQAHTHCAAAQLVVTAAQPWSPETHGLFPAEARAKAAALLFSCAHVLRHRCRCTTDSVLAKHMTVALLSFLVARNP